MGSDLKIELNKKEAKKSAYFKGGVLKEKEVQSPTAGSEVTLPKDKIPEEVIVDKKFVADKLEKIHYQGGELRRADQVEPDSVYFETIQSGEFDPTIRVDDCTFESRALEDEAKLIARMLTGLSKRAYKEAEAKGKWNGTSTNDAILWLVSEAIELYKAAERNEGSIEEELADVLIMSLSIAGKLEIDIGSEVLAKMEKNKSR